VHTRRRRDMQVTPTALAGVWIIEEERHSDARGYFARTFDATVFATHGLETVWRQCSLSHNHRRGTLRGLHYQAAPHEETKLVRCIRGAVHDVIVDLRPSSATVHQHVSVELTAENGRAVYVPPGTAHGFQTLVDDTDLFYQITPDYVTAAAAGVRFDDPLLRIAWPLPVSVISARDQSFAELRHADHVAGPARTR
jgi:dTDP-4-dehydrorhamnose 3,5-epimerase